MPSANNFEYYARGELVKSGGDGSFGMDYSVRGEPPIALGAEPPIVYTLMPTGVPSAGAFGAPMYSGATVNQGSLVTQIGAEIAATAAFGLARVTAAHVEVAAQMSGGQVRATAVHAEIAAQMSRTRVLVTAITRETAAWMSGARVRVTALNIEYAVGAAPDAPPDDPPDDPPGIVLPPPGTTLDPLPPTCDCCAGKWTTAIIPSVSWTDDTALATPWTADTPPVTPWTMPDCC